MKSTRLKSLSRFPADAKEDFRIAVQHYGYGSLNAFFQACVIALVEHHKKGENLTSPLTFTSAGKQK